MSAVVILQSGALFLIAGLCEIAGGYLVWLWLRDGRGAMLGAAGGLILFLYGVVPTFQPAHFGRVYAACGGVFVILSLLRGWRSAGILPGFGDLSETAVGRCVADPAGVPPMRYGYQS